MAEFAIVGPIFFLLLFGLIQLGIVFGSQNGVVNAVRETARRAATYRIGESTIQVQLGAGAGTGICGQAEDELDAQLSAAVPGYSATNLDPTISWTWRSDGSGTWFLYATVDVQYRHPLYVPLVSVILDGFDADPGGGNLILGASEQMRVENPALNPTTRQDITCP